MRIISRDPRLRAALIGVSFAVLPLLGGAARADEPAPQGVVDFTDTESIAGLAAQVDAFSSGLILFEGQEAVLECLDIVEGRNGTHTVYARYATSERDPFWLHIANHVQGSTQAMAGVEQRSVSEQHCGAAEVAPVTMFMMTCSTHDILRDLP